MAQQAKAAPLTFVRDITVLCGFDWRTRDADGTPSVKYTEFLKRRLPYDGFASVVTWPWRTYSKLDYSLSEYKRWVADNKSEHNTYMCQ